MPSQLHEVLVAMVRESGAMARQLAEWAMGEPFPPQHALRTRDQSYSEIRPPEYRADLVFEVVSGRGEKPKAMVIFEVQLSRDPDKRRTWPAYQAVLRAQYGCPTSVVVLAPDAAVAQWCAEPIVLDGRGASVMRPAVVGPSSVPIITDPAEAALAPGIAALSVIAHGRGRHGLSIGRAGLCAADVLDGADGSLYADLVLHHLDEAARRALEHEMALKLKNKYEYQSSTAKRFVAEGEAEGKVRALEVVLGARGFVVDEETRGRLAACDSERLDELIVRAVNIESLDALFDGR